MPRTKPFPVRRPRSIKRGVADGKPTIDRKWTGRQWINPAQNNGDARIRWEVTQSSGPYPDLDGKFYISDCNKRIDLDFFGGTLKRYRYSCAKIDRIVDELLKFKLAMYSAAKAHGLKVDG